MKAILEKFPKSVLIEFIREAVSPFRYESADDLEGQLLFIQWNCETPALLDEMDAAAAAMTAADTDTLEGRSAWFAAQKRWGKANNRYKKADRLLEQSKQLRGR